MRLSKVAVDFVARYRPDPDSQQQQQERYSPPLQGGGNKRNVNRKKKQQEQKRISEGLATSKEGGVVRRVNNIGTYTIYPMNY